MPFNSPFLFTYFQRVDTKRLPTLRLNQPYQSCQWPQRLQLVASLHPTRGSPTG